MGARRMTLAVLVLFVGVAGWECDGKKPTRHDPRLGHVMILASVPPSAPQSPGAAKATVTQARLRVEAGDGTTQDTLSTVRDGFVRLQLQGIPVGPATLTLVLLEASGDTLWRASQQVRIEADKTVSASMTLERTGDTAPIAVLSASPSMGRPDTTFVLEAEVSDRHDPTDSLQVRWDVDGDGTYEVSWTQEKQTSSRYASAGNYTVVLQARDRSGHTTTATRQVQVVALQAVLGPSPGADTLEVAAGSQSVDLNATASGAGEQAVTYRWGQVLDYPAAKDRSVLGTLTDNNSATADRVSFRPDLGPGLYVFTLEVELQVEGGTVVSKADTLLVYVHSQQPVASVDEVAVPVELGQSVELQGHGSDEEGDALTYRWRGTAVAGLSDSTAATTHFTPEAAGEYTFIFVAIDTDPQESEAVSLTVVVTQPGPIARLIATPTAGVAPLTVTFGNQSEYAESYLWSFGTGTTSTNETPGEAVYVSEGQYVLMLRAYGAGDRADSTALTIVVTGRPRPDVLVESAFMVDKDDASAVLQQVDEGATVSFQIHLLNSGSAPADDLVVTAHLVGADVTLLSSTSLHLDAEGRLTVPTATWVAAAGPDTLRVRVSTTDDANTANNVLDVSFHVNGRSAVGNTAPEADAGEDQGVAVGDVVALDGSGSSDVDGDEVSYRWTEGTENPATGILSDTTSAAPRFTAMAAGTYRFTLVVSDGSAESTPAEVLVRVTDGDNDLPKISITSPADSSSFVAGDTITFEGAGIDTEDGRLPSEALEWTTGEEVLGVGGSVSVSILGAGTHVITLTGTDSQGGVAAASIVVSVRENRAPVADAGPDQAVLVGDGVLLDGGGSTDADGDELSYVWRQVGGPAVALADTTHRTIDFVPTQPGTYVMSLVLNDGRANSDQDQVVVTVEESDRQVLVETLPGGVSMEFVWIDPGRFVMGSPETEEERSWTEGPQHEVTIRQGFWLGRYEITQDHWESVMGTRPWLASISTLSR